MERITIQLSKIIKSIPDEAQYNALLSELVAVQKDLRTLRGQLADMCDSTDGFAALANIMEGKILKVIAQI